MRNLQDSISKKCRQYDLFYQQIDSTHVNFENNKLRNIEQVFSNGLGLRIIKNNRVGFSSTTDVNDTAALVSNSLQTVRFGEKAYFDFPEEKIKKHDLEICSRDIEKVDNSNLLSWGHFFIDSILKLDKKLKVNVFIEKRLTKKGLYNDKLALEEKRSLISLMVGLFKAEKNNFLEIWDYKKYMDLPDLSELKELLERISFLYQHSQYIIPVHKGYYKVFFTAKAFSTLMMLLVDSFHGRLYEKKVSYFYDKINQKVAGNYINIFDDPGKRKFPYSTGFDGDGLKPQKVYFIKNGVVKDFVFDLQTAGKLKFKSNGHGMRSYNSLPAPGFTNVVFDVQDNILLDNSKNIIKGLDHGLIIDQFLGAGQSNTIGGEFSANIELGYLVKKGKITGRIKDCMITGNIFDFLNNIIKVEDKQQLYSRYYVPGVLLDKISVVPK